jgi:hypothetical protein
VTNVKPCVCANGSKMSLTVRRGLPPDADERGPSLAAGGAICPSTAWRRSRPSRRRQQSEGRSPGDLERVWNHPAATPETRKRILRTVIVEIIARVDDDQIDLKIHWQEGDHTQLNVRTFK